MATPPEVDQDQNMYANFDMTDDLKGAYISIPQFYAGRSVFITGGTGFMGKVRHFRNQRNEEGFSIQFVHFVSVQVLVEKLLRSCPDIKNIYLLMRPKRGQEVAARLNELLNSPVSFNVFHKLSTTIQQTCYKSVNFHIFSLFFEPEFFPGFSPDLSSFLIQFAKSDRMSSIK